jgi:hypothetical protein
LRRAGIQQNFMINVFLERANGFCFPAPQYKVAEPKSTQTRSISRLFRPLKALHPADVI